MFLSIATSNMVATALAKRVSFSFGFGTSLAFTIVQSWTYELKFVLCDKNHFLKELYNFIV